MMINAGFIYIHTTYYLLPTTTTTTTTTTWIIMDDHWISMIVMDYCGLSLNFNAYFGLSWIICSRFKVLSVEGLWTWSHLDYQWLLLIPIECQWLLLIIMDYYWYYCYYYLGHNGFSWTIIEFHSLLWIIIDYDGSSSAQGSKFLVSWRALKNEAPWIIIDYHGIMIEFQWLSWIIMG